MLRRFVAPCPALPCPALQAGDRASEHLTAAKDNAKEAAHGARRSADEHLSAAGTNCKRDRRGVCIRCQMHDLDSKASTSLMAEHRLCSCLVVQGCASVASVCLLSMARVFR
jgi:hypothetical protein